MAKLFILAILLSSTLVRSEVEKVRVPDEDGGADWILEVDDDLVKSQYRDGVSLFIIFNSYSLNNH